jgi:hypothetical protein
VAARRARAGRRDASGALVLLALGLMLKETTLPIGLALAAVVLAWAILPARGPRSWPGVARTVLLLLFPMALYLAVRLTAPTLRSARGVHLDPSAMGVFLQAPLWVALARGLVTRSGGGRGPPSLGWRRPWRRWPPSP